MKVYKISAVTLMIKKMARSCDFYSQIPGFKLIYGGLCNDAFTTYQIGENPHKMHLNLELRSRFNHDHKNYYDDTRIMDFGRIIFQTKDVDKLYWYLKNNERISHLIRFESEPTDAPWGERYFHIQEPDGYFLSFAKPYKKKYLRS
jgi:catechol 2,3-dioxygenase-like lactoylglutathione lyase family enzyme